MTPTPLPDSITVYEAERELHWVDPDLDYPYIDRAASHVAAFLNEGGPAGVAYQPGDGTYYGLVFVPLRLIRDADPRYSNGQEWDKHSVRGLLDTAAVEDTAGLPRPGGMAGINALPYLRDAYLIAHLEHTAYPIRLGSHRNDVLAADYVREHWNLPGVSACSVAILLRAVSHHLDALARAAR